MAVTATHDTRTRLRETLENRKIELQAKAEDIRNEILECDRLLNDTTIVLRLPPEILSNIFIRYASMYRFNTPEKFNWIRAFNACSRWRRIALNTPSIWSRIPMTCQPWHDEMMRRASSGPIDINCHHPGAIVNLNDMDPANMDTTSRNLIATLATFRMRTMIIGSSSDGIEAILRNVCTSAPFLESVVVLSSQEGGMAALPVGFLGDSAPRLTSIVIDGIAMIGAPNPSIFTHVTTLGLYNCSGFGPHMKQMLDILENARGLQNLMLKNTLPPGEADGSRIVALHHLKVLQLNGDADGCVALLSHLLYPQKVQITLEVHGIETDISILHPYIRVNNGSCQGEGDITYLSMMTRKYSNAEVITFRGQIVDLINQLVFSVVLEAPVTQVMTHSLIQSVMSALHIEHINVLSIHVFPDLPIDLWSNIFARLDCLHTLTLRGRSSHGIIRSLGAILDGRSIVPTLERLELEGVNFDLRYSSPEPFWGALENCLSIRGSNGSRILSLNIEECPSFNKDRMFKLRQLVAHVHWDDCDEDDESDGGGEDAEMDE